LIFLFIFYGLFYISSLPVFLHTSHFVFGQQKKDTKNLLLIFDVFLLIKGLRLNVAPGTAYPEQKTLLRGKPCIKNNPFIW